MFGDYAYVFVSEKIIDSVGFLSILKKNSKGVKMRILVFSKPEF